MQDYYRFRFHKMRPPRRASSWDRVDGRDRPPMPTPLKFVYGSSLILAGFGWVCAALTGVGDPMWTLPIIEFCALSLPIALLFALGFSEDERWTRPLLILISAVPAAIAFLAGANHYGAGSAVVPLSMATYLYRSASAREYYSFLREVQVVRLSISDLTSPDFYPMYLGFIGASLGGYGGRALVIWELGYVADFAAFDLFGLICTALLGAAVLGWLGWTLGVWLCERRRRAT